MALNFKAIWTLPDCIPLQEFWKAHQWHPNADWDFYHTIVQTRKEVLAPCVIVAYEGNEIVALVAGRLEATTLPIGIGYAKLANPAVRQIVLITGGFIGPWVREIYSRLQSFIETLLIEHRADLALIAQVRLSSPFHNVLLASPRRQRAIAARDASLHWMMRLPPAWPEFLASRSKKHRYWIKRLSNILDRDFPSSWSMKLYSSPDESAFFLKAAEKIADTTYHRGLGVGIRADEQNLRRLRLEAERGQLRGYLLFLKDKPCAFWYCSIYGKTLHLCTTGYDSSLRHYELGTVLLMKVFQDHCGSSIEAVDFGLGDAGYKQRFGTENFTETSFYLFARTRRGYLLSVLIWAASRGNDLARGALDKLRLTQFIKTYWRRLFSKNSAKAETKSTEAKKSSEPDSEDA